MVTVLSGIKASPASPYHPPPNPIPNTSPGIDHLGCLYPTAIFRVVVFAPTVGEIILGKIISSTAEHIRGALPIATLPVMVRSRSGRIRM